MTLAWWKRRLRTMEDIGEEWRRRPACGAGRAGFVEVALPRGSGVVGGQREFVELAAPRGSAVVGGRRGLCLREPRVPGPLVTCGGYELLLPGGVGLRLPDDFDPERVAGLVRALVAAGMDLSAQSRGLAGDSAC